jgi:uncharacterized membrane protein YkoI
MKRRIVIAAAVLAAALGAATFALGGGAGGIWDDDHFARPGALDDGKELLPQAKITLAQANAAAQRAADGALGQVDLEHFKGRVVYAVDVGDREVRVDAADGSVLDVRPRD